MNTVKHDINWATNLTMNIIKDLGYNDIDQPWQYFNPELDDVDDLECVRRLTAFIVHAERGFNLKSMDMARLMIFLANPDMNTCCVEILEGLEGQGLLD